MLEPSVVSTASQVGSPTGKRLPAWVQSTSEPGLPEHSAPLGYIMVTMEYVNQPEEVTIAGEIPTIIRQLDG
jgi:hypothetical protein